MKNKTLLLGMILLIVSFLLAACTGDNSETEDNENQNNKETNTEEGMNNESNTSNEETADGNSDESMSEHMSSDGDVPEELDMAENPTYEFGTTAIITAEHMNMEGMTGAEAKIVEAYDTTAYAVTYTPTNGGEPVENHKWVIHEELENPGEEPLEPGTEVTLNADHMEGMDGAEATIDSAEDTTVYMVNFKPTNGGEEVFNHKWVIESELRPVEPAD
ncbi:DUF1541 domain-containing protein [Oceanobacillus piezotolerans]|uniref:DUF1541 domain-containing protein n=1 Tax=Oceanobacillus piezotolerans TaxID=2448030 RepID=A0A498DCK0_9BACI|nr:YdhK family protein [Oceanobacillus piezotolerans]RLL45473.1 DUF1541 domain-containing protein [Oceanobacillus piezotolerans]